jgi:flagellar hook-basal body complex protein FliE
MEIKGIDRILPPNVEPPAKGGGASRETRDFGAVLSESLAAVNQLQAEADQATEALATGRGISLHETMIALERADLSFRLMMQVRNKIVEAYQEILRIQV